MENRRKDAITHAIIYSGITLIFAIILFTVGYLLNFSTNGMIPIMIMVTTAIIVIFSIIQHDVS